MGVVQIQIVRAAGVARCLHAEFFRAVTAEEIAFDDAVFHHKTRLRGDAFGIEISAAERAQDMRFFTQAEKLGQHLFADTVNQEAALAIERAAAECADKVAD